MQVYHKNIPTWNQETQKWSRTSFDSQEDFADFLLTICFKEPGEYELDETTLKFNEFGRCFKANGYYTTYAPGTSEYIDFWDFEEDKSRLGVIWKNKGKTWYTTRDYYFCLNYCPAINKEELGKFTFISVRDGQLHMMLYEKIAEAKHLHSVILKKRQFFFSGCHAAKMVNYLFFENNKTLKILASDDAYLNTVNGCWKQIDGYRNHLNKHTDWKRDFVPGEYPELKQVSKVMGPNRQWVYEGNDSTLIAKSLKRDVTTAVGGAGYFYWWEEGGIAPKADIALSYIDPALKSGNKRTGSFCIGGSVGDLDDCKPLEKFLNNPEKYGFLGVPTKWVDDTGKVEIKGLFIPTQYGMDGAVDEWGNSLVDKALQIIKEQELEWEKLEPQEYILNKSQNPKTIKEAFDSRNINEFDVKKLQRQQDRIKEIESKNLYEGGKKPIKCLLKEDKNGKIVYDTHNLPLEHSYPIKKEWTDKRGVVTIYKEPEEENPKLGTYFGGLDPIEVDVTISSDSVASLDIIKKRIEVETIDENGKSVKHFEGGELVATYRGRFNTVEETNEQMWLLIRLYNAQTLVERNKPNFINYMKRNGRANLFLAKESDIPLYKEESINSFLRDSPFGFLKGANNLGMWKYMKDSFKEYSQEEFGFVYKSDGSVLKVFTGIDKIPDYWLLEELIRYDEENLKNHDRIVSFLAAITLWKIKESNSRIEKTVKYIKEPVLQNTEQYIDRRTSLLGGFSNIKRNKKISLI